MSRQNGPGAPGWPDYRPAEAADPYSDPYYAQQRQPAQQPLAPQPQAQAQPQPNRAPRLQAGAPSRSPQTGLPNGGFPGNGAYPQQQAPHAPQQAPQGYYPAPQQGYAPQQPQAPQGYPPAQGYAQPVPRTQPPQAATGYGQPNGYAPQPQTGYVPAPQPQNTAAGQAYVPRTQPPAPQAPPPQSRPAAPTSYAPQGYEQAYDSVPPSGRPALQQPASYPPAYTPAPSAYAPDPRQAQPVTQRPQPQAAPAYNQWPAPAQPAVPPPAAPASSYDFGNYSPAPAADPRTQRPTGQPQWQQEPSLGQQTLAPDFSHLSAADAATNHALEPVHDEGYEHEDDEEYEDEEPRRSRYGLIAASLIAAIAMGGGLAYAYKVFVAPPSQTAATAVIKNSGGPMKVKPVDPGGTKFANADSKMMEQLDGSSSQSNDGGPKRVPTIEIGRDGSLNVPPPAAPPPVQAGASPTVPGMVLANVPPPAAQPAAAPPPPAAQQPPKTAPKIIAAAPPPAAEADAAAMAAPAPKKLAPKKVAAVAAPSAVGGPKTGNGYVAVLASVPVSASSKDEAMKQFAGLQQKYGAVLGSKAPDVVEAKLPNGNYHRLVVGPPASREAAGSVCSQLKASGYTSDCWVTAF